MKIFMLSVLVCGSCFCHECALTVEVRSSDGQPLETEVRLLKSGSIERTAISRKGKAEFCDFSYGKHEILAAPNECLPTKISNISIIPYSPMKLTVMVNSCDGYPKWLSDYNPERHVTACIIQARIQDFLGMAIDGASISHMGNAVLQIAPPDVDPKANVPKVKPIQTQSTADSYGRAWLMVGTIGRQPNERIRLRVSKPGYQQGSLEFTCKDGIQEMTVTLTKANQ